MILMENSFKSMFKVHCTSSIYSSEFEKKYIYLENLHPVTTSEFNINVCFSYTFKFEHKINT